MFIYIYIECNMYFQTMQHVQCIYACMCICMYDCMCICMYMYMYVYVCICLCMYMYMCVQYAYVYIYRYSIYLNSFVFTYIYIYIHTEMCPVCAYIHLNNYIHINIYLYVFMIYVNTVWILIAILWQIQLSHSAGNGTLHFAPWKLVLFQKTTRVSIWRKILLGF